jgi:type IV pilus assembly protein PilM
MSLFRKSAIGIEITPFGIKAVLMHGRRAMPILDRYSSTPFQSEVIKCSLRDPNVLDAAAFVAATRESVNSLLSRESRVSVSLPDQSGRVLLVDLESTFKTKQEGIDLIRWKLKKSFPFPVQDAQLDFVFIEEKVSGELTVLVSCISQSILHQYEELLLQAGVEPYQIDFSSFNLFQLFAPRFTLGERKAFMSWFGGVLSMLVFHEGKMYFCRTKEIFGDRMDVNRIYREINSSMLVYRTKNPGFTLQDVFCFSTLEDSEAFTTVVGEATGLEPFQLDIAKTVELAEPKPDRFSLVNLAAATGAAVRTL